MKSAPIVTVTLRGLPGANGDVEARHVHSKTTLLHALQQRKFRAIVAAGDFGSVTAYRDDHGQLRANFCRWFYVVNARKFNTVKELKVWLDYWFPKMHEVK